MRQCAQSHLSLALTREASEDPEIKRSAKEAAETFMRRIPYRGLKVIHGWALPLMRRIICADYGDRDENAPQPEPENVPEADRPN